MPSATPYFSAATISAVSSKRRKCTAEVFCSFSRGEILVGDRVDAARSPRPATQTRSSMPLSRASARLRSSASSYSISIVALKFDAVGHERVVGVELVLDACLLEGLLDAQHLLDLVADRELVLEQQRHVVAEVHGALLLVREHPGAEVLALARIGLERQQAVAGDAGHRRLLGCVRHGPVLLMRAVAPTRSAGGQRQSMP